MSIQWFPGHMNTARKEAAKTMAVIDVVIELLDARMPEASCNPMIKELRLQRRRPCLKVLNKADLTATLLARYPAPLTARYGFAVEGLDGAGLLEAIAKKRGCLRKSKGGEPDREMAARILLADYREGKPGRTSLETPETRETMLTR